MNIQERIEALETEFAAKIKALKAEVQREQEFPKNGDNYWYVYDDAEVMDIEWDGSDCDQGRLSIGNVFKTREEAEFAVEKLKVEAELRQFSKPFTYREPNWYLIMDFDKEVHYSYNWDDVAQGTIHFESEEKIKEAIKSVGKERIKKYIFGVEAE